MQPAITFTILLWGIALIGAQPMNMDSSAGSESEHLTVNREMNNSVPRENSKEPNRKDVLALIETTTEPWPSTDHHRNNSTDESTTERLPIGFEQRLSATILKVLAILG